VSLADQFWRHTADMVAAATIDRDHDVPYLSNRSTDGKTVYIDQRVPEILPCGIRPDETLPWHELSEFLGENAGLTYQTAHTEVADAIEKRRVEELGGDWKTYSKEITPFIREVGHEGITDVPADLDLRPYEDEDDRKVMAELAAAGSAKAKAVAKVFNSDQPRDDHGRWTAGEGGEKEHAEILGADKSTGGAVKASAVTLYQGNGDGREGIGKVIRETDKAYLVDAESDTAVGRKSEQVWFPKSQVSVENGQVLSPHWLVEAKNKDLAENSLLGAGNHYGLVTDTRGTEQDMYKVSLQYDADRVAAFKDAIGAKTWNRFDKSWYVPIGERSALAKFIESQSS
jgi:hypothetical protein